MITSSRGIELIKKYEGLRLAAYQDSVGVWTIGYGHTLGVSAGDTCTDAQATAWLVSDVQFAERIVESSVGSSLTQGQFDALVSFVFNVGPGKAGVKDGFLTLKNGNPSTMLRLLRSGDYAGAAAQFPLWASAGGKKLTGLVRRREAEKALFESDAPAVALAAAPAVAPEASDDKATLAKAKGLIAEALVLLNSIGE